MKGLQEKLGAELSGLSQRVADLRGQSHKYEAVDGAKNQVRHFWSDYTRCAQRADVSLRVTNSQIRSHEYGAVDGANSQVRHCLS